MVTSTLVKNLSLAAGAAITLALGTSSAQAATLANGNFEDGFNGWQTIGDTSINNGEASLQSSSSALDVNLESFLGLAAGSLDGLGNGDATFGSAIKQTIAAKAGDVLTFDWKFKAGDYLPYNDFSFFSIGSALSELADVKFVGDYGSTGPKTFSYTFQNAGSYILGFGVANVKDGGLSSQLSVDNVTVTSATSVPEPASVLGLVAVGAMGAGSALKRKQGQKA
jgi:hypothetical protein